MWFFYIFYSIRVCRHESQFIADLHSQLSHPPDGDLFIVLFVAIDGKQQIGDQSCEDLHHKAILAPGNQVVYLQMPLPPGEEVLDIPPELIGRRNLLCGEVVPVRGNPVFHMVNLIPDQTKRSLRLIDVGCTEQNSGIVKPYCRMGSDEIRGRSFWCLP